MARVRLAQHSDFTQVDRDKTYSQEQLLNGKVHLRRQAPRRLAAGRLIAKALLRLCLPDGFLARMVGSRRIRNNRLSKKPFGKLAPLRVTRVLALSWGQMIGILFCSSEGPGRSTHARGSP